jgi:ribosome-associated heat shock protein Hsp15
VRLNGERAAPGVRVQVGDRVEVVRDRPSFSMEIAAISARRGPASEAQARYSEDEAVIR